MTSSHTPGTRKDRITNQWVAFAPSRSERPTQTNSDDESHSPEDNCPVKGCPFCPGHEEMLPSILWELDRGDSGPWSTRVVPNKYAALTPDRAASDQTHGLYQSRASRGRQEVLIETPRHYQHLAQMPVAQVDAMLQTYLERYHVIRQDNEEFIPFLFRNHGASAGASIAHPHSQLIAPDFPPPQIKREECAARTRFEELGRCPYCAMIENELETESRLVRTSESYIVFVPFAAEVPYEMWILPREHEPEFGHLTDDQRWELATALHDVLSRLRTHLDDPDYNFFVRTALEYESNKPHLHWSLRIRPRTTVQAGYEQGTGQRINPSIPERDAAVLRNEPS